MHTLSFVCDRLISTVFSLVLGFVLGRWDPPETMHEPAGVVPVHPRRGGLLDVTDGAQRALAERGIVGDALGLVQSDRRLRQGIIVGVTYRPDRRPKSLQEQGLPKSQSRILGGFNRSSQHP